MTSEMEIKAVRVRAASGYAIRVSGVTHASSTTSDCFDGVVFLRGNRAARAKFIVVNSAWHYVDKALNRESIPGSALVEGTRVSEADARRFASKLTAGRVIPVVEE